MIISDEKLSILNIKRIDSLSNEDLDLLNSSKYKEKDILITKKKELVVKNPFNPNISFVKKEFGSEVVSFINEEIFNSLSSKLIISSYKSTILDKMGEEEYSISYKLDETEISKVLENYFSMAVQRKVSDIHILPKEKQTIIRFRENGELNTIDVLPKHYAEFIINKIKTESKLDISNKLTPQDGKLKIEVDNTIIELRVSTLPTVFGENSVLRIQETASLLGKSLEDTGFEKEDLELYRSKFTESSGLILNVGGTGAGKTNTFYLTINELINLYPDKNIMTAEDPVEMKNEKITQIEIDEKQKRTYPVVLKSLLRQDPNIILIGEIRDEETAAIGIRSSLTGHLVLATLHANDSFNAISRLRDIGIENQLISSTGSCFLSQKLVKKLCPKCKKEREIPLDKKISLDLNFEKDFIAVGCDFCNHKGYVGRIAVVEVLSIDEEIKSAISSGKSEIDIKKIMKRKGFQNLWINGLKKVERGITTLDEIQKELKRDAIFNFETKDENQKVDTRIIFYPDTIINAIVKDIPCKVFDISEKGISFIFDAPQFLSIGKEIDSVVENEKIKFTPKGYGKNKDKFIVSGLYYGNLKKYSEE